MNEEETTILLCCCGWGDACRKIQENILALPSGSVCDLWKKPPIKIEKGLPEKSRKTIANMRRHLKVPAQQDPALYVIARHHFSLALLAWKEESSKNRQWVKPLTRQQAKNFGCPTGKIDQHPNRSKGEIVYYQAPNVTKYYISQLLLSLTSSRGQRQQKRQRTDEVSFVNDTAAMVQLTHVEIPNEDVAATFGYTLSATTAIPTASISAVLAISIPTSFEINDYSTILPLSESCPTDTPHCVAVIASPMDDVSFQSAISPNVLFENEADHDFVVGENNDGPADIEKMNKTNDTGKHADDENMEKIEFEIDDIVGRNTCSPVRSIASCVGIKHYLFRTYLCSNDDSYAYQRGKALSYWNYDGNSWFSKSCLKRTDGGLQSCANCLSVDIRSRNYPWLFRGTKDNSPSSFDDQHAAPPANLNANASLLLPTNDAIIPLIKHLFQSFHLGKTYPPINSFLQWEDLKKACALLSPDVSCIPLDDVGAQYLIRCEGNDFEDVQEDRIRHMFIATKENVRCCTNCLRDRKNWKRREKRKEQKYEQRTQSSSRTRLDYQMWNYLITKTCHARIGVVTREFAENTTGRY